MNRNIFITLLAIFQSLSVLSQTKVIDMHIHSYTDSDFGLRESEGDSPGGKSATNANDHLKATFAAFAKWNVVKAVVSGNPESVRNWAAKDTNNRIIKGILMYSPEDYGMDTTKLERMIINKEIEVFGELGPFYVGTSLSDPIWEPYLRICEKYDIPVAVHTGGGGPSITYSWAPKARLKFGDPYLIEDVLVKFPKLRIYIMHAGEDWYEHALRLMAFYPQLYTDIAVLLWVEPLTQDYVTQFLKAAKHAGYLNRVMFGSDQMIWAEAIEKSIQFLNSLTFLTKKDKEDILYNNAATFLKLKK